MKLFLDTNILIDFLRDDRGEFHEAALALFNLIAKRATASCLSTSQVTDVHYILGRYGADEDAIRAKLRDLASICELVPTSPQACMAALESPMRDYEDAVQAETAREARCDYVITRDTADYERSPVPALNPENFIARFKGALEGQDAEPSQG